MFYRIDKIFLRILKNKRISFDKYDKNIFYNNEMPMEFKIEFIINDTVYYYELSFINNKVTNEIFKKNNVIILDRNKNSKVVNTIQETLGDRLEELYLNFLPKEYNVDLYAVEKFINSFEFLNRNTKLNINKMFENNNFEEISNIIKLLNLHIDSLIDNRKEVEKIRDTTPIDESMLEELKVSTKYSFKGNEQVIPFGLIDSAGTIEITKLIYTIISAIKENKILIIDEIETSIHTLIIKSIILYYNSHNSFSQLIATTHDLLLLDDNLLLRKDQIWFTHKNEDGNYLYCLSEFKDNSDNDPRGNIMKKYLKGLFGGLPEPRWFNN